jgi:hypothetical protein
MAEPQTAAGKEQKARVEDRKQAEAQKRRVWCCYNGEVDFVLFGSELNALRYMAEHHMDGCKPVEYGVPLREQIK